MRLSVHVNDHDDEDDDDDNPTHPHTTVTPITQAAVHLHAADMTLGPDALLRLDGPALSALLAQHHALHHPGLPLPPHDAFIASSGGGGGKAASLTVAEEAEAVRREIEVLKLALAGANARLFLLGLLSWPGVMEAVRAEEGGFAPLEEAARLLGRYALHDEGAEEGMELGVEEDLHLGVFGDVAGMCVVVRMMDWVRWVEVT